MGYRNYLYKIPKKNIKELRSLTKQQMIDKYAEEDYIYFGKMLEENNAKCIFGYGKLYWDDTIERLHKTGERLFKDETVNELFEEEDIYLLGEKALEEFINIYKEKIVKMYNNLLDNNDNIPDKELIEKYEEHLKDYKLWWTRLNALNLCKNNDCICDSWLYEHQIFELVRLYKTIDFENYDLLFLGW